MNLVLPTAGERPGVEANIRSAPEDFLVEEQLGFEPEGAGEHVFLHLQKTSLNTQDLLQRVSSLSATHPRDIGYSGLKDRNAITRQWLSVGLAGRTEPDWLALEADGQVKVLSVARHRKKLRRGVHKSNRFTLVLRNLQGDLELLKSSLSRVQLQGVPNYFGGQRFGRGGSTLLQARLWLQQGGRVSRNKKSLYLSALRSQLFNLLLADRVASGYWNILQAGDMCALQGSRSLFPAELLDADLQRRCEEGDVHPALPLWGTGEQPAGTQQLEQWSRLLQGEAATMNFLEEQGLELAWRPARVLADDFCWQFCDDGGLQLRFALPVGSYATAVLAELVETIEGEVGSGNGSE